MEKTPTAQAEEGFESAIESKEAMEERIEVLESVVKHFSDDILPLMNHHENTSRVEFKKEGGYDDREKRKSFAGLLSGLTKFENYLESLHDLFSQSGDALGMANILNSVRYTKDRLIAAPDVRQSQAATIEMYGGRENVPAGENIDTFEMTQKSLDSLKSEIQGISAALQFIKPTLK